MTRQENPFSPCAPGEPSGVAPIRPALGLTAAEEKNNRGSVSPIFSAEDAEPCSAPENDCRSCREAMASAAHDLKTPVSILDGYIEMMLREKLGPLSESQRSALQEMRDNGKRLHGFVENFLTLCTFMDPLLDLEIATADLNACLAEIVQVWTPTFQSKGVALFIAPGDQIEPFPFDYYKVQHVVSNLLDNARKFTPAGGSVWLTSELRVWERRSRQHSVRPAFDRRRISAPAPNGVCVTVADSGPGIEPEFHQEIFREHFRANHGAEGHGLGLPIAQRLVNRVGGKIWVESEPGSGAKFAFFLPLKPPC